MYRAGEYAVMMLLVHTTGALWTDLDGNHTENATVPDGGFVPVLFTKVHQIIAREGNCALIDCNVTGDPYPDVLWFNSHGERLDTNSIGKTTLAVQHVTGNHAGLLIHNPLNHECLTFPGHPQNTQLPSLSNRDITLSWHLENVFNSSIKGLIVYLLQETAPLYSIGSSCDIAMALV